MPDMGDIGGSVEAFGGGPEAQSGNGGSGTSGGSQGGPNLDLSPGSPPGVVGVMDSHLDLPTMQFASNLTTQDMSRLATTVGLTIGTVAAIGAGSPTAPGLMLSTVGAVSANMDALGRAAADAHAAMDNPGAFATTSETYDAGGFVVGSAADATYQASIYLPQQWGSGDTSAGGG